MKPPCPICQQTHNPENACREAQPVAEQLRASLAPKFTLGPWEICSMAGHPAVFGGGRILASPRGYSIAELRDSEACRTETIANAHLIAAAPDIYGALVGLLARHMDGSEEHLWAEWDTAREALAKADGK